MKYVLIKNGVVKEFVNQKEASEFLGINQVTFSRRFNSQNPYISGWKVEGKIKNKTNKKYIVETLEKYEIKIAELENRITMLESERFRSLMGDDLK